jgi:hypothetical protein
MKIARFATVLLLIVLAHPAQAKREEVVVQIEQGGPVAEQLQRVELALKGESYSEISQEDRDRAQAALARIRSRMEGLERVDQLHPDARTAIYNDQELVNTILTRAHADSRMVCRRERTTGSNRPQQVCMTVAQQRQISENARETMLNQQRSQAAAVSR